MSGEELYINGQPCDLDSNTNVTLKIVSNLFGDVSKIASNSTYTINLPRTEKNQKIFGLAEYPTSVSGAQGIKMTCDYYRSGCKMIDKGGAILTGANEKSYSLSVMYGVGDKLMQISENGTSIQDLDNVSNQKLVTMKDSYKPNNPEYEELEVLTKYSSRGQSVLLAEYNPFTYNKPPLANSYWNDQYGKVTYLGGVESGIRNWNSVGDHILPCVSVYNILQKYVSQGVNVSFADDTRRDITKNIAIPLATKNANANTANLTKFIHTLVGQQSGGQEEEDGITSVELGIGANGGNSLFRRVQEGYANQYHLESTLTMNNNVELYGSISITFNKIIYLMNGKDKNNQLVAMGIKPYIILKYGDNNLRCECTYLSHANSGNKTTIYLNFYAKGLLHIESDDEVRVFIKCPKTGIYYQIGINNSGDLKINTSQIEEGEVPNGFKLPVYANLPSITMLELLKSVAFITGTFPRNINGGNVITLANISDIFTRKNTANSVDWSKKLVSVNEMSAPGSVSFNFDNWARRNWYKMKDNEFLREGFNGSIDLENGTLTNERDVYTLPFVAGDSCHYPLYEKKTTTEGGVTTTEYTFKEGKAAIFEIVKNTYTINGVNYEYCGLNFNTKEGIVKPSSIIPRYYSDMQRVLNKPFVLTANVNLTDIDIANFDETKPVYLAQYGHYYAVLEISTTYGKYAQVKLLQI